jgi:hypothetical protein
MRQGEKDIIRYAGIGFVIALSFLVLTTLMSRLMYYYASGADMASPLHPKSSYIEHDLPELEWVATHAEIPWNGYLKKQVAKDYLHAWKRLNKCIKNQDYSTMKDFFDEALIARIVAEDSLTYDTKIQIDLDHHLTLHHLSKDYAVVVFTDKDVWVRTEEKSIDGRTLVKDRVYDFDVKMVLQDGNWKVYNWTPIENKKVTLAASPNTEYFQENMDFIHSMKGVNYYPANTPWLDFWENYDSDICSDDMQIMHNMGFNTVRIFISLLDLGRDKINLNMIYKFEDLLCRAAENNIRVLPTLFDFPLGFDLEYYPSYYRQIRYLTRYYAHDQRIVSWSLKNEADLDFDNHGRDQVIRWLSFLINVAKSEDTNHPLTVGWAQYESADLLSDQLDYVSIHHYESLSRLDKFNQKMKTKDQFFVIEEFGFTSAVAPWSLFLNTQSRQAARINDVVEYANSENIPWLVWTLHDFNEAPKDVFGWKPWIRIDQKKYGLLDKEGQLKKSATSIMKYTN